MDTSANARSVGKGFTLVEMLVVITIIGMLMGMLTVVVMGTRKRFRSGVVENEITQLEMSLQNCKSEATDFPPTFMNLTSTDADLHNAGQAAVVRYLRKAFPRYVPGAPRKLAAGGFFNPDMGRPPDATEFDRFANDVYYAYKYPDRTTGVPTVDPLGFDPASALVFFLGGLPERVTRVDAANPFDSSLDIEPYIPAGFHTDPQNPFRPGLPRTQPLFDFKPERIRRVEMHYEDPLNATSTQVPRYLRYYPERVSAEASPYAYFKAHRVALPQPGSSPPQFVSTWQYGTLRSGDTDIRQHYYAHAVVGQPLGNFCVPYCRPNPTWSLRWRSQDTFQIVAPGVDNHFGTTPPMDLTSGAQLFRQSKTGQLFTNGDYDNLTSFSEGRLQDEME